MAIPHLLSDEAACAYQGYLLAHMAVYQTRAYFLEKFGYLTDNPEIGPLLAKHYWHAGNHLSHNETIVSLTGEALTPSTLQTCVTYPQNRRGKCSRRKSTHLQHENEHQSLH